MMNVIPVVAQSSNLRMRFLFFFGLRVHNNAVQCADGALLHVDASEVMDRKARFVMCDIFVP